MIEELERNYAQVDFYDPYIHKYKKDGRENTGLDKIDGETVRAYDLVIITTAHTAVV